MSILKKSVSLLLTVVMMFSVVFGAVSAVELETSAEVQSDAGAGTGDEGEGISSLSTEIVYGDINGDGKINLDDVIKLLRHVSKADVITDPNALEAAEIVDDGKLNLDDVIRLLRYVSKAIPNLKEEPELYHRELTEEAIVTDEETGTMFASGEIVIVTEFDVKKGYVEDLIAPYDGEIVGVIELAKTYQVYFEGLSSLAELEALAETFSADESVQSAIVNYVSEYSLNWEAPNDYEEYFEEWNDSSSAIGYEWNLEAIDMVDAWELIEYDGAINVGVIDGAFNDHEDLNYIKIWENNSDVEDGDVDHGNHVSGIIGASWNNDRGVAGIVKDANIYGYAYLTNNSRNRNSVSAFTYAVSQMLKNDARVINFSIGRTSVEDHKMSNSNLEKMQKDAKMIESYLLNLLHSGEDFLIVQAAGNDSNSNNPKKSLFGSIEYNKQGWVDTKWSSVLSHITNQRVRDHIIIVGALGVKYQAGKPEYSIAGYSNVGKEVDILAPGGSVVEGANGRYQWNLIYNTGAFENNQLIDSSYVYKMGTSMAAPHVTGVASLIWAIKPTLSGPEIKSILLNNCKNSYRLNTSKQSSYVNVVDLDKNGEEVVGVVSNPTVDESVKDQIFVYPVLNAEAAVAAALDYKAVTAHVTESVLGTPVKDAKITLYSDTSDTEMVFNVDDKGSLWEYISSPVLVNRAKIEAPGYVSQDVELKYSYVKNAYALGEIVLEKAQDSFSVMHGSEDVLALGSVEMYNGSAEANWTINSTLDWSVTVNGDSSWFELSSVSGVAGSSNLKLTFKDGTSSSNEATLTFVSGELSFSVEIYRKAYSFYGAVSDGTTAVEGAKVLIENEYYSSEVYTDSNGYFIVKVPNAFYNITISKDGVGSKTLTSYEMNGADVDLGAIVLASESRNIILEFTNGDGHLCKLDDTGLLTVENVDLAFFDDSPFSLYKNMINKMDIVPIAESSDRYIIAESISTNRDSIMTLDDTGLIIWEGENVNVLFSSLPFEEQGYELKKISVIFVPYIESRNIIAEGVCGENLTWALDDKGLLTVDGEGVMYDYSNDNGSQPWYNYRDKILNIVINKSVKSIGACAFSYCINLTEVLLLNGLTSIGDYAFAYCSGLTEISLPDSLISIGKSAFSSCNLTEISLPYGLTVLEDNVFYDCGNLTEVSLPDGLTSIGGYAFSRCSRLNKISFPDGLTSIKGYAFSYCSGLTDITLPDGLISIGRNAFYKCSNLTEISFPDGLTSIGNLAFYECDSLTIILLPDGLTSIGDNAFYECSSLTEISFPDGLTSIGDYAFAYCSGLTEISLPNGLISIGRFAFLKCTGLTNISLPDGLISIENNAFYNCSNLKAVYFYGDVPSSWKSSVFNADNSDLVIYYLDGKEGWTSPTWTAPDGTVYNTAIWTP